MRNVFRCFAFGNPRPEILGLKSRFIRLRPPSSHKVTACPFERTILRMKIYFKKPFKCYLTTPKNEVPHLQATFEESGYSICISLSTQDDKVLELQNVPPEDKYFVITSNIDFILTPISHDESDRFSYEAMSDKNLRKDLLKLIVRIINKSLQAIRNFGIMPHVQMFNPDISYTDYYLSSLNVKLLDDEGEHYISQSKNLLGEIWARRALPSTSETPPASDLHVFRWPDIEEALQDQSEPPPEKEFFTNAVEFLRIRNFRMALLEAVICLEIVLTQYLQYLKTYLSIRKTVPNSRIKKFLSPQMGLSIRLSGLLDLTLTKDDLKDIDLNKVIHVVEWRNSIVHRTGRLPKYLTEEELRNGISNVLTLALLLAQSRDRIQAEPVLQDIAKKISELHKIPVPNVFDIGRHLILVEIQFFFATLPDNEILEEVSKDLGEHLKIRDSRFIPDKHLFIRFLKFPKVTVARWRKGSLEIVHEQKEIKT